MFLDHVCSTGETELYEGATFLTERQGGSDVGANVVQAVKEADHYRLYGEKYFASNAGMCGVATVLARMEGAHEGSKGLTLFAVPWRNEYGRLNGIKIRRLKDKLGVRAVPSGEVEFDGAKAYVIGEPDKGFYYMMEALNLSRICNAVASLGIMRRAYTEAFDYTSKRNAFGKRLQDYPMVQETLAQLRTKLHAEMIVVFDLIKLFEKAANGNATEKEIVLHRLFIAMMKKETAEQAIAFCHEAIELHGGNGYMEDFVTPRLLRDAQVLTVWEGTENILGMELVRLVRKYDAHVIYMDDMKQRIKLLNTSSLAGKLKEKLAQLEEKLIRFAEMDNELQTLEAKPLLKQMALLYESILTVEWAEKYDGKYKYLAEIYMEMNWNERIIGDKPSGFNIFIRLLQNDPIDNSIAVKFKRDSDNQIQLFESLLIWVYFIIQRLHTKSKQYFCIERGLPLQVVAFRGRLISLAPARGMPMLPAKGVLVGNPHLYLRGLIYTLLPQESTTYVSASH